MAKLSTFFVPAALAALAVTATPAMASSAIHQTRYHGSSHYVGHGQAASLQRDISRLGSQIDRARDRRQISQREANNLRKDVRNLQRQLTQSQRRGLTRAEARSIEVRIARVSRELQADRRGNNWRRS